MLAEWVLFAVVGRVAVYIGGKFPLPLFLERIEKIKRLHECPLCFGVWVYGFLSLFMQMDLLTGLGFQYVPFVSEVVTGSCMSLLVHLIVLGYKTQFEVIVV